MNLKIMDNWIYSNHNKCWIFRGGGNTNNVLKQQYINSLDNWIAKNPNYKGIDTKYFRDFFIELVNAESKYQRNVKSLNKNKTRGSYTGWYQTKGDENRSEDQQHKDAYEHLYKLLNNSITKEDLTVGQKKGFSQAAILAKYWNQQNRVTNYLHRGKDHEDGAGAKISQVGNNFTSNIDIYDLVPKAITGDYVILGNKQGVASFSQRIRNANIDYTNPVKYIDSLNKNRILTNPTYKTVKREYPNFWPQDTIYIKPSKLLDNAPRTE